MVELLLVLCVVVIAVLAVMVAVLWIQLWLSRRDARIARQMMLLAQLPDEPAAGGCLGSLMGPVILILLGLLVLALMQA